MDFYINKGSLYPRLKMKLASDSGLDVNKFNEMLENCAVTFSMVDISNKTFKIANKPGEMLSLINDYTKELEYYIIYQWGDNDVNKTGTYQAEFKIDFLGDYCRSLIVPIKEPLYVHIQDSITKTTVIKL